MTFNNYYQNNYNNGESYLKYFINELDENSDKFVANISSNIILKQHQLTLLNRCIDIENNKFITKPYSINTENEPLNNDLIDNEQLNNDLIDNEQLNNDLIDNEPLNNDLIDNDLIEFHNFELCSKLHFPISEYDIIRFRRRYNEINNITHNNENEINKEFIINMINNFADKIIREHNLQTDYAILGDKTGSGKSYVILSLILMSSIKKRKKIHTCNIGNMITYQKISKYIDYNYNVIVIPHNIKTQWNTYLKDFGAGLSYILIDSAKSSKMFIENYDTKYKNLNVVLITGNFYKFVEIHFKEKNIRVDRLIFDEADTSKIVSCRPIKANFYWFITASYKNLMYPYKYAVDYSQEYRNLARYISSGIDNNKFIKEHFKSNFEYSKASIFNKLILDSLIIKNNDNYVNNSFDLPDIKYIIVRCKDPVYINILRNIASNQIIKYLHGGDIQSAINCVNKNNVNTEENIINKILEDYKIKIDNIIIKIDCATRLTYENDIDRNTQLNKLNSDKNELVVKYELLKERITSNNECIICYSDIKIKTITQCCNNAFCLECITTWLLTSDKCPLCKKITTLDNLYCTNDLIKDEIIKNKGYSYEEHTKMENLLYLLKKIKKKNENAKFLIFAEYENTFIEIETQLKKNNIYYEKIKGNAINNIIIRYKTTTLNILLINTKNYGSGLNLENTTDIILFHKLDSEIEKQVIGRAQRPGRTGRLKVWYLLNKSENDDFNNLENTTNENENEIINF